MLFWLLGCFQITDEERAEWKIRYPSDSDQPYFSVDATVLPSDNIRVGTEISCSSKAFDEDGVELVPVYRWMNGEEQIAFEETYIVDADDVEVDDTITCVAVIIDLSGEENISEASVSVENSDPEIASIGVTFEDLFNDSILTCEVIAEDADEDDLTISYKWTKNASSFGVGEQTLGFIRV